VIPGPDESVSFEQHVKPLFRQRDRQSMEWAFDLWSYGDVGQHADVILDRLQTGVLPCDGAWPQPKIDFVPTLGHHRQTELTWPDSRVPLPSKSTLPDLAVGIPSGVGFVELHVGRNVTR
jgi:hypothetical protein